MLCLIIFVDNLLRRIDGHEEMMWFGVSAGKWELILVSGVLCLVCHLLFWSRIAPRAIHESADNNGTSQSGIPSTLNTVAGHDGFNEFFDHTRCGNSIIA